MEGHLVSSIDKQRDRDAKDGNLGWPKRNAEVDSQVQPDLEIDDDVF